MKVNKNLQPVSIPIEPHNQYIKMTPEEALKEIYNGMSNNIGFVKEFKNIEQALERAKKLEELLGLYQKKEQCIVYVPVMKDSSILHCVVRYSEDEKYMRILKQIKQLEEELK